eukprot:scaffold11817_cov31-Phaeocystis_antarctica.AAC.1
MVRGGRRCGHWLRTMVLVRQVGTARRWWRRSAEGCGCRFRALGAGGIEQMRAGGRGGAGVRTILEPLYGEAKRKRIQQHRNDRWLS